MSKKTKTERLGIRVDEQFLAKLEHLATARRRKLSDMIRIVLEDEIDRYEANVADPQADYNTPKQQSQFVEAPQANDENGEKTA